MCVDIVDVIVFLDQVSRAFWPDTCHTGDIVGRIPLDRLDLDQLFGRHTVFCFDRLGRIHHRTVEVLGEAHGNAVIDQLQAVSVTGRDNAGIPRIDTGLGECTQNIIRFVPFTGHDPITEVGEQLFQRRHLLMQLLRHPLAVRFI